jgi:putative transposase
MPRPKRIRIAAISQHLIHRGNDRLDIFRCERDHLVFLTMLKDASVRFRTAIHGYVLMKTHFHVLGTPEVQNAIEKTMQVLGTRYVRYFNRCYGRTGTLFEGKYEASIVDDERYWISCLRYIELNPVRAGIVKTPDEYRWSSYRAHAFGTQDPLLTPHPRYRELGSTPAARQHVWRQLCGVDVSAEELNRIRFAAWEDRVLRSWRIEKAS